MEGKFRFDLFIDGAREMMRPWYKLGYSLNENETIVERGGKFLKALMPNATIIADEMRLYMIQEEQILL